MQIVFTQDYLSEKYIKVVNILKQANAVEDLFPFNSLNYEKLSGNKVGIESVRVTDKYRLEFRT